MKSKLNIPPEAMKYMTIGIEFAGIFMVVLFIGVFLDRRFGHTPLFIVLGMIGGFAGAMYRVLRTANDYQKQRDIYPGPSLPEEDGSDSGDSEAEDEDRGQREG